MYLETETEVLSGIELYQMTFDMCNAHPQSHGEQLLLGIIQFLKETVTIIRQQVWARSDIIFAYAKHWTKYQIASGYLNVICECLNRQMKKRVTPFKTVHSPPQNPEKYTVQEVSSIIMIAQLFNLETYFAEGYKG